MAGALFGGVVFLHKHEAVLKEQLLAVQKEQAQQDAMFRLRRVEEESQEDRAKLAGYMLTEDSQSIEVLTRIEGYAPQVGVSLTTTNLEQSSNPDTGEGWLQIGFTFSGTEEQVEQFIQILESIPYVSYLTSVSLRANASGEWDAGTTLNVLLLP